MPPKYKRGGANNRDKRHENGLAPPVKQIKKQKSDGLLNGHPDKLPTRASPTALPVTADDPFSLPPNEHSSHAFRSSDQDVAASAESAMGPEPSGVFATIDTHHSPVGTARDTSSDFPSLSSHDSLALSSTDFTAESASERQLFPTESANTVIAPWSIVDIIAILMVLMQLPSTVLTLVNVVFAFLTFGAPAAGWSTSTVASASEWLQSHGGNPSLVTMVFLDVLFLGVWSLTPGWGKDMFLDFSQAVVAISLGGCSSGMHAKLNGFMSIAAICIYHLLGVDTVWRNIPLRIFAYMVSLFTSQTDIGPLEYKDLLDAFDVVPDTGRSWPRILLEIHIVTQGVVRVLRRSLARTSVPRTTNKKTATLTESLNGPAALENATDGARNTSADGRQPGPSPALKDSREKVISSGKKRRKQATFVRSQQPFWAAIASTKVTVSKEIEQSQSSRDSFEAGASSPERLGSASNNCFDDSVWVSDIHDTEVWFSAVSFGGDKCHADTSRDGQKQLLVDAAGDFLVVRVNGAEWSQASVVRGGQRDGKTILTGKIFGLTALTNYRVEFIRGRDGALLHSVNLLTRPHASLEDQAPIEGTFRPSSPLSTLRKSISAAESNLAEHRNRSKKTKRDHKSATNQLRREVEMIENRLSSSTGTDERQRQRQIQFRQNIKQAEDSFESISEEIEHLGEIPEDERQGAAESRRRWKKAEKSYNASREDVDGARMSRERQLAAAKAETTQQQQKQERLAARLNKLNIQRDGLLAAQAQDNRTQQQRDLSRLSELQARADMERSYTNNVQRLKNERDSLLEQQARLEQQIILLETDQYAPSMAPFGPDGTKRTPESAFASPAYGVPSHATTSGVPSGFGMNPFGVPVLGQTGAQLDSRRGSLIGKGNRGRSSSMLSNVSAFTDDEIDGPRPSGPAAAPNGVYHSGGNSGVYADRQGSTGSSTSQRQQEEGAPGSGPGSRPATTSPKPKLSPIGAGRASPRNGNGGGLGIGR